MVRELKKRISEMFAPPSKNGFFIINPRAAEKKLHELADEMRKDWGATHEERNAWYERWLAEEDDIAHG